ncbi:MAG: 23S rRNA (adenine(2503)-C(2))-methyltransferase RlmN, partial [Actinobacteria bacterium]|nr:23S rRNA (adenine(2503)-C(2))-methyltransferase RlmN [Actinomycetota bacterium]
MEAIIVSLFDVTRDELAELLHDQPPFRLKQVWEGLYSNLQEPSQILTLPGALRERLDSELPPAL